MRRIFVAAALALLLTTSAVRAEDNWTIGLPKQSPLVNLRSTSASPVTQIQPVIGSVQRKSHFTNPITHRAKYTKLTYNPLLGTFNKHKFRQ